MQSMGFLMVYNTLPNIEKIIVEQMVLYNDRNLAAT